MSSNPLSQKDIGNFVLTFAKKATEILKKTFINDLFSVCLYGSAVKADLRTGSDIDLLIVLADAPRSYHKRIKKIMPSLSEMRNTPEFTLLESNGLDFEPSPLVLTCAEATSHPAIFIDISQEGVLLFDREDFLQKHLREVRDKMQAFKAEKKHTPHGYYWILKPNIEAGEVIEI